MTRRQRRAQGDGSIYERADGRWCAQVPVAFGERRFLYGRTRAEVKRRFDDAMRLVDAGLPLPPQRETVASFLTTWLDGQPSRVRDRTWMRREQLELSNIAVEALRRHRARQSQQRLMLGEHRQEHDLVFPNSRGLPRTEVTW